MLLGGAVLEGRHVVSFEKKVCENNKDFSGGSDSKESACNARDLGSIPGWERSPGEGNGNPLQYSCLEDPMDRRAWRAAVHGATKSRTRLKRLTHTHTQESGGGEC